MTANYPSRQREAVNQGDAELPERSKRWNTQLAHRLLRRLRPEEACASAQFYGTFQGWLNDSVALRVSSQLHAPGAILPTFHRDTSIVEQHAQTVVPTSRNHPCGLRHRQWPVFAAGFGVLPFASGLALYSRNFACQLHETL